MTHLSIGAVERDTGLSKDVLRVWERRYGFPHPDRDANGERMYPLAQVEQLRAIKRLMDSGHRPGKLLALEPSELGLMSARHLRPKPRDDLGESQRQILDLLSRNDAFGFRQQLAQLLMKQGLQEFVSKTIPPLNRAVGEAWMRGEMHAYQEHTYTELVQVVLRSAIHAIDQRSGKPTILLATFPNEQHGLGLLMAQALLASEGASCISLGTQSPIAEIVAAANAYRADVVALSFSAAYSGKLALSGLQSLRQMLPTHVAIWIGGDLIGRIRSDTPGIVSTSSIADILATLRKWRVAHPSP